jgi:AcrR family transcriptional regulator
MSTTREYDMSSRSQSVEATRRTILDAATEMFLARWYEDVTLTDIARYAGVSGQTVINHFGGKEQLFGAVVEHGSAHVVAHRFAVEPGDVQAAIEALVDDYDRNGDATIRMLQQEARLPVLRPAIELGRTGHRRWVETVFLRPDLAMELVVATDVYAWKLLRRDNGLDRDATIAAMRRTVEALLTITEEP